MPFIAALDPGFIDILFKFLIGCFIGTSFSSRLLISQDSCFDLKVRGAGTGWFGRRSKAQY